MKQFYSFGLTILAACLALAGVSDLRKSGSAQEPIPPVWDVLADDFESGNLDLWERSSTQNPFLAPGAGINGSTGLAVAVGSDSSYLYQTEIAKAEEGYLTFWFNPNQVDIPDEGTSWVPGKSLSIAEVVNSDDWWPPLVALYVRRPAGEGYQAYLAWPSDAADQRTYDYENAFELFEGW
jgi:hypothetical protein